ncbi:flagellar basal body rod protein FlgB [Priestia filamentosa]|uniref:Flagellar basal body rod protein FlgB n=1 Tax=Priestia filamentosa TaxID=1402861 RepID=A0A1X7D667_9BACI|nr:flagellar basal body rod protein FlgB [Priestia filamentosa]AKO93845.1 flagellar basal-body rod protein FlgB [Priestia filamentosa]MDT3764084.1 flagellar basal body rod protein FlgB [Priestia filamentosa]OXS71442.1 flagellar basal body rod protein FlgB [Priestia filamentosa]RJS67085.1 flagellar basal body rod protein FlgB [Priestia filamentosa]WCM14719.1 flagellar basal body rod protein FlgB [Priestia filamentosa]
MELFSQTMSSIQTGLNYASLKQKTISNNIANVDTPGYKAKTVSFKSMLQAEQDNLLKATRTDPRHFEFSTSSSSLGVTTGHNAYQSNGNGVDVDKEMTDMAQNQLYYQALVDRMSGKFNSLNTVLRGGN